MPVPSKIARLVALSDSEFERKRASPIRRRFKARNVNLSALDKDWERQRGAAARFMGVILGIDSEELYAKVSSDAGTASTYSDAVEWLQKESSLLRKTAERLDLAASRLGSAITRHREAMEAAAANEPTINASA